MPRFDDKLLDDIRAAVKVSEVVGRKTKLVRKGPGEFVGLSPLRADSSPDSFTVNDAKGFYHDFATAEHGDIFAFIQASEGVDFPEAVKICAEIAGISHEGERSARRAENDHQRAPEKREHSSNDAHRKSSRRAIARTYDYADAQGSLIYQVVRFEPKGFAQRRPSPDGDSSWVWGLDLKDDDCEPYEFMRKRDGADWQRFDAEKFENWRYEQRKRFKGENVVHGLYRMQELKQMLDLSRDERPAIHITEGEKDAELLASWGFIATTNSGGAKHWTEWHAAQFDGCDVVLHPDNDKAGRERIEKIAPTLKLSAARVRVCDLSKSWAEMPDKGDLSDWAAAGGNADKLYAIIDASPEWVPAPHASKFGRIRWADQEQPNVVEYEWWVKGVIPKRETIAVVGATQTGKSFETFNLAMHIARGVDYRGCRTKQGLVIYCAMEGGKGFRDRMRGYRQYHGLGLEDTPFEVLTRRADLFSNEVDLKELIAEIKTIASEYKHELALIVIDTYSAATPGLKENTSEDISRVRQRVVQIEKECNCGVLFVDHTNAVGDKVRGHTSKTADIETQLNVEWLMKRDGKDLVHVEDENRRRIRRITVFKQREGESGRHWDFVLKRLDVRKDADGDPVTTCVSIDPQREAQHDEPRRQSDRKAGGGWLSTDNQVNLFKSLLRALDIKGFVPPLSLQLPQSIGKVVKWIDVGAEYRRLYPIEEHEKPDSYRDKIKKRVRDARERMIRMGVIGIDQIKDADGGEGFHIAWVTGKRVTAQGFEWPPKPQVVQTIASAAASDPLLDDDKGETSLF